MDEMDYGLYAPAPATTTPWPRLQTPAGRYPDFIPSRYARIMRRHQLDDFSPHDYHQAPQYPANFGAHHIINQWRQQGFPDVRIQAIGNSSAGPGPQQSSGAIVLGPPTPQGGSGSLTNANSLAEHTARTSNQTDAN